MKKGFANLLILIIVFAVVIIFIAIATIKSYAVTGDSMKPTFKNGQKIIVNKLAYISGSPKRGDIIVVGVDDNTSKIKPTIRRVVGLPGETVEIRQGRVYINGGILDEPYIDNAKESGLDEKVGVDSAHYLVLADNRNTDYYRGTDISVWSLSPKNFIVGKYWFSY